MNRMNGNSLISWFLVYSSITLVGGLGIALLTAISSKLVPVPIRLYGPTVIIPFSLLAIVGCRRRRTCYVIPYLVSRFIEAAFLVTSLILAFFGKLDLLINYKEMAQEINSSHEALRTVALVVTVTVIVFNIFVITTGIRIMKNSSAKNLVDSGQSSALLTQSWICRRKRGWTKVPCDLIDHWKESSQGLTFTLLRSPNFLKLFT